jgi:hypothetical protein
VHIAVGPWRAGIEDAWADLGDFVPRLALALGVLVVGWLCAVVTAKLVALAMDRVATGEEHRGRVLTVAVQVRRAVPRLVRLGVLLVSLWTAVEVVDPGSAESPAADFVDALRGLLLFLGTAAVLTVCAVVVVGVGGGLVRPMERRWELWIGRLEDPASGGAREGTDPGGAHDVPADTPAGPTRSGEPARSAESRTRPEPVVSDSSRTQVIPAATDTTADDGTAEADDAARDEGQDPGDSTRTDVMPAGRSPLDR